MKTKTEKKTTRTAKKTTQETRSSKKQRVNEVFEEGASQCIKKCMSFGMKTKSKWIFIAIPDVVEFKDDDGAKVAEPIRDGMVIATTGDDVIPLFEKYYNQKNFDIFCGTSGLHNKIIKNNTSKPFNVFGKLINRQCMEESAVSTEEGPMEEEEEEEVSDDADE